MGATRDSRVWLGDTEWAYDVTADLDGWSYATTYPTNVSIRSQGNEHIDKLEFDVNAQLSLSRFYYNDTSKQMAGRSRCKAFVISDSYTDSQGRTVPALWRGGDAKVRGIPHDAPSSDAITQTAEFVPFEFAKWARGNFVNRFTLSSSERSANLPGSVTNAQVGWLVTLVKPSPTERPLKLASGGSSINVSVERPSVLPLDLSRLPAGSITNLQLTQQSSGAQDIEGFVIIGDPYNPPNQLPSV